jgi:hypothetical protein
VNGLAKLPQDFADLLIELCERKAEFLLVGGWAVILYGHVRATDDMDIFVRSSTSNSERVFAALEAFGAPLRAHSVAPGHFAREGDAYRFGLAPLKLQTDADRARVLEGLASATHANDGASLAHLADITKRLAHRWFLIRDVHAKGGARLLQPRWAMSFMRGPMTGTELRRAREANTPSASNAGSTV